MFGLGIWELLIILAIIVVLFGAKRLPLIGEGLGGMITNFKSATKKNKEDQENIDQLMIDLDGSENKGKLGANAILAVSMANLKAFSHSSKKQIYEVIPNLYGPPSLPVPFMNILNGGAHADNKIDIQEFMIVPHGFDTFDASLEAGVEIYHTLKNLLKDKGLSTNVGDEGGFAPNLTSSLDVLETIINSVEKAGYKPGDEVSVALDAAASEFYKDEKIFQFAQEIGVELIDMSESKNE